MSMHSRELQDFASDRLAGRFASIATLAFALFVSLASALPALAADLGTVRGVVHDSQHRPIENATVTVHGQSGVWSKATQSNANGEFEVDDVPAGDYVVTVMPQALVPWTRPSRWREERTPYCICNSRSRLFNNPWKLRKLPVS